VSGRGYDSPVRREKARATERRILEAARDLLLSEGWSGTPMTAIAARAGVSAQLLYKTFGTKAALAKRLWDVTLVGDDEPVPLDERPEIAAIVAEPDPRRKIAAYARLGRAVNERLGPLSARLRGAAAAGDADLAELIAATDRERLVGNAGIVRHLASLGALRPGLTVERGTDMVWTLMSPEVFHRLTAERGWSFDAAEEWLADQLCAALLGQ
jgi:AcrR family transcriptional regulator